MTTQLLDPAGRASMATAIMMSHHGLRRDLARFASALQRLEPGDAARAEALREEWSKYRATLHGHHTAEDNGLFPGLVAEHPETRDAIAKLDADHRRIDPLLERGDVAFEALAVGTADAQAVVAELSRLLHAHLEVEEKEVIGYLRSAHSFPAFDDAVAAMYADGFAWSAQGIADDVLEQVFAMLPDNVVSRLPAARKAFDERCVRVWGSAACGVTRTSVPAGV